MKCLKVISFVALLAPGLSFAEDKTASHPTTAPAATVPAATTTTPAPTPAAATEHGAVQAHPTATAEEKTDKKAFCAKNKEEAAAKCNTWLSSQKSAHKEKLVDSKCSEAAAATKADKGCKAGSHISHGEVKFHN